MTTIAFSYGLTKPGEVPYSSEQFRASIELDIGDDPEVGIALTQLATDVKLLVINEAGLSATVDENGVTSAAFVNRQPIAPVIPINQGAPGPNTYNPEVDGPRFGDEATAQAYAEVQAAQPAVPVQQQQGRGPTSPSVTSVWDGRPVTVYDNRPKKVAPGVTPNKELGQHAANAADFAIKFLDVPAETPNNEKYKSVWIKNQNGSINQAGLALAALFDSQ